MKDDTVRDSFLAFARERTQMMYDKGSWRNWRKYCGLINKLQAFCKEKEIADITFGDLTVDFMIKFDDFLHKWENVHDRGKLLHPNTIQVQHNIMKALVHRAIEVELMDASRNPFTKFKFKGVKTIREKLSSAEINRIINLNIPRGTSVWHCRNYFLFSFYCAGIRAADLIQLRWRNITDTGRLCYQMGKNHKIRDLVLVDQALDILADYRSESVNPDSYIFPLLGNDAPYARYVTQSDRDSMPADMRAKLYIDVSSRNAFINRNLKQIAKMADIRVNLTMHISRHAFAHIALESGTVSTAIKEILGHSNLATTERYMGSFDTSRTDRTLRNLFANSADLQLKPSQTKKYSSNQELAISLLKTMTPEQILAVFHAIRE